MILKDQVNKGGLHQKEAIALLLMFPKISMPTKGKIGSSLRKVKKSFTF